METIQVASVPDSQKNSIGPLARDLRTALSYLSFYSSDSPFVIQSIQKLQKSLQRLQDVFGTLVFHLKDGLLHLNDLPVGDAGDFPRYLKERNLLGLEIPSGFSAAELVSRLKQLTLPASMGFPELETTSRIRPLTWEVLLDILPQPEPLPEAQGTAPDPLPHAVRTVPIPSAYVDLDALRAPAPSPLPIPSKPLPVPEALPVAAPAVDEALLGFVAEAWQYSLSQRTAAGTGSDESFQKLFFRLLDRLEGTSPGLSEITRWFKAPEGEWVEGTTELAMMPLMEVALRNGWTSVLFDPTTEGLVSDCLAHWGSDGKEDLVEKAVSRLSEGLSGTPTEKQLALAHLQDPRPWVSNPALVEKVLSRLNALLASETLAGPYQSALLLAWDLSGPALSSGKDGSVLTLLSTLHFHADENEASFPERSRIARHWLFERSNPDLVRRLAFCAQKAGHLSHYPLLGEMAAPVLLGDFLAAPPSDKVQYFPLFSDLKEPLRSTLAEFLAEVRSEEEVRPMLPLLRIVGLDPGLSLQLCAWVSLGSRTFRVELLSLLEEIADPAGGPALRLALFDDHGETAALAARVIGKMRFTAGVPVLLKAIKVRMERFEDNEGFLVAACRSLGELGDARALAFLEEAARKHLLLRGKNYPVPVRLAAIEALARIDRPEAWRFLETLAEEKNGAVQEILERVTKERTESLSH